MRVDEDVLVQQQAAVNAEFKAMQSSYEAMIHHAAAQCMAGIDSVPDQERPKRSIAPWIRHIICLPFRTTTRTGRRPTEHVTSPQASSMDHIIEVAGQVLDAASARTDGTKGEP